MGVMVWKTTLIAMILAAAAAHAEPVTATLHADRLSDPVSQYEYGMFIEPIGGLEV